MWLVCGSSSDSYETASSELDDVQERFIQDGLVTVEEGRLIVSTWGRFFSRNICRAFDKFWKNKNYKITGP